MCGGGDGELCGCRAIAFPPEAGGGLVGDRLQGDRLPGALAGCKRSLREVIAGVGGELSDGGLA